MKLLRTIILLPAAVVLVGTFLFINLAGYLLAARERYPNE